MPLKQLLLALLGFALFQYGLSSFAAEPVDVYRSKSAWQDQGGKAFRLDSLRGRWTVFTLAYSTCPTVCSMTVASLRKLAAHAPDGPELVLLSVDPAHDSPESRASFLKAQGVAEGSAKWHFLAGEEKATRELAQALGMRFGQASASRAAHISHTLRFALVNPAGRMVSTVDGPQLDPAAFLRPALTDAAGGRDGSPAAR